MAKQSETLFKERVLADLKEIGGWWVKVQQVAISGTPDILGCYKGRFVAIELKANAASRISSLQKYNLRKIESNFGVSMVVTPDTWGAALATLQTLGGVT